MAKITDEMIKRALLVGRLRLEKVENTHRNVGKNPPLVLAEALEDLEGLPVDWRVSETPRDFIQRMKKELNAHLDCGWPIGPIEVAVADYQRMLDILKEHVK